MENTIPPSLFDSPKLPSALCPVVLTGDTGLGHWPLSRVRMPLAFQKQHGPSPFEQVLTGLNLLHHSLPPIITLPSSAVLLAQSQIEDQPSHCIVEQVDRGSLPGAIAAAFLAAQTDSNATLVFINGSQPPTDWMALHRLCQSTLASPLQETSVIVTAQPVRENYPGLKICRVSKTVDPNLTTCRIVDGPTKDRLYRPGPVMLARARTFLQRCKNLWPTLHTTVSRAIEQNKTVKEYLWPNINDWAHMDSADLFQAFLDNDPELLMRPADIAPQLRARSNKETFGFQAASNNCHIDAQDHVVALYGVSNLRVVSTADATLITPTDKDPDITTLVEQLKQSDCPEVYDFPLHHFNWGNQQELAGNEHYTIMRLTIKPGATIPPHVHYQRAETWHVLQGEGIAEIGSEKITLVPGMTLDLPDSAKHGVTNSGTQPLVLVEMRRGSVLSDRGTNRVRTQINAPSIEKQLGKPETV